MDRKQGALEVIRATAQHLIDRPRTTFWLSLLIIAAMLYFEKGHDLAAWWRGPWIKPIIDVSMIDGNPAITMTRKIARETGAGFYIGQLEGNSMAKPCSSIKRFYPYLQSERNTIGPMTVGEWLNNLNCESYIHEGAAFTIFGGWCRDANCHDYAAHSPILIVMP